MSDERERADLLESLRLHRGFLRHTVQGLTDEQARTRTTASELTLGGLVKHVARMEERWTAFVRSGPDAMAQTADSWAEHTDSFVLGEDETLVGVLARYEEVARRTDELLAELPDLDAAHPL